VYVVRLGEDLVPEVYVRGMVNFVEPGWHGVGSDEHPSLAHQRLTPVKVEEIAEEHVEDEERVHDRVHVVRPEVRDAQKEHVRLALDRDHHLLVVVPQGLGVDWLGGAGLDAGHPVRSLYGVGDAPSGAEWHRLRGLVGGEEVCPGDGAPPLDRKSTRLNSSHANISYAVFCLKK